MFAWQPSYPSKSVKTIWNSYDVVWPFGYSSVVLKLSGGVWWLQWDVVTAWPHIIGGAVTDSGTVHESQKASQ